jgi:hypothetical protein
MPARTRSTIKLRPSSAAASDFRKDRQGARARFARVVDREDEKPVPSCKWVQRRRCGSRGGSRSSRFHKRLLRRGYCGGRSARDFRRDGLRLGERNVLMCAVMGFRRIKRKNAAQRFVAILDLFELRHRRRELGRSRDTDNRAPWVPASGRAFVRR